MKKCKNVFKRLEEKFIKSEIKVGEDYDLKNYT